MLVPGYTSSTNYYKLTYMFASGFQPVEGKKLTAQYNINENLRYIPKLTIMKKTLILLACTFAVFAVNAQVKFGIKAGVNLTTFAGSDAKMTSDIGDISISPSHKIGFAGGGFANYKLSDIISLQGEVLYSLEGASYKFDGEKMNVNSSYVNVPVLAQYNHSSGFYAETGPQVGFLTSAKMSFDGDSQDIKDGYKSVSFAWALGLGYKLSNGLGIGARYNLGLSKLSDEGSSNVKNGGFHLGIFYTFGAGE